MLHLELDAREIYNEKTQEFSYTEPRTIQMEHSLFTISKWESIHKKPFLGVAEKSQEELLDYVRLMCVDGITVDELYMLQREDFVKINEYIGSTESATTFSNKPGAPNREIVTAEILYYYMFSSQIPLEAEHWHLNRLMILLRVHGEKSKPPKKMSKQEAIAHQRAINAQRR